MYHVQIREGSHAVRAFNLTAQQVRTRFLKPLAADAPFTMEDREWQPRKTRLTIYEGAALRPDQITMGRGWPNAQRAGTDVTQQMLDQPVPGSADSVRPPVTDQLKERLIGRISGGEITMRDVAQLAASLTSGQRVSQQLAVAELAVWELLHEQTAQLEDGGRVIADRDWELVLLALDSWLQASGQVALAQRSIPE